MNSLYVFFSIILAFGPVGICDGNTRRATPYAKLNKRAVTYILSMQKGEREREGVKFEFSLDLIREIS